MDAKRSLAISADTEGWTRFFGPFFSPVEHGREQDRCFSHSQKNGT
jgi:hypothetical protein